ncbi:hypothetical protein ABNB59_21140 [Paenibacillus larvae]
MSLAQMLYEKTGKKSGPAYASNIMKGYKVRSEAADFRAVRGTAQRILERFEERSESNDSQV